MSKGLQRDWLLKRKGGYRKFHDAQDDFETSRISNKEIIVVKKLTDCGSLELGFLEEKIKNYKEGKESE